MGFFNLFKKNNKKEAKASGVIPEAIDMIGSIGKDFEFLITGDIDISNDEFDKIMTPLSFEWEKIEKDNWNYYAIGNDEFSYSFEPPGIQMTFNREMDFTKAKKIADEVIENIKSTGQQAELVIIDKGNIYKF